MNLANWTGIRNCTESIHAYYAYICTSLLPFLFLNLAVFCATIALRRSTNVACCLSKTTIISCWSFNMSPNSACGFPFRCRSNDWKFIYNQWQRYMIYAQSLLTELLDYCKEISPVRLSQLNHKQYISVTLLAHFHSCRWVNLRSYPYYAHVLRPM